MKRQTCPYCGSYFPTEELVKQRAVNKWKVKEGEPHARAFRYTCPTCGNIIRARRNWEAWVLIFAIMALAMWLREHDFVGVTWSNSLIIVVGLVVGFWHEERFVYFKKPTGSSEQ